MAELTLQYYQAYVRRIRFLLHLGCLFRHPHLPRPAYAIIVILITSINVFLFCGMINFCLENLKDFHKLCPGMIVACSASVGFVKVVCFWRKYKGLKKLDDTLTILFDLELRDESRRSSLLFLLPPFQRIARSYNFVVACTCVFYHLVVLWTIPSQFIHHVEPKRCPLPVPSSFPWTIQGCGILYLAHYFTNICSSVYLYFLSVDAEVSFGYYAFHIAGIFRTMGDRLENPEPNESRILLLRSCAKKHKVLLHCRDILEDVYGPIIVFLVLTNGIAMCSLIFQAFQSKMTYGRIMVLASYLLVKFMQTSVYTWCATMITTESEKFAESVYFSDWTDKSVTLKSDMMITMIQKPLIINALGLFIVSMDLIPKVVNTTLSYYFLLKTLDEN